MTAYYHDTYGDDKNRFFTAFLLILGIIVFVAWNRLNDNAKHIEQAAIANALKSVKPAAPADTPAPAPAPAEPPVTRRLTRRQSTKALINTSKK